MAELHEALAARVDAWRAAGHPHGRFPAIGEILGFAVEDEEEGALTGACAVAVPPRSDSPVAVRITDMLGEEILVVEEREP